MVIFSYSFNFEFQFRFNTTRYRPKANVSQGLISIILKKVVFIYVEAYRSNGKQPQTKGFDMVSAIGWLFGKTKTPPVECTNSDIVLEGDAGAVNVERYENGAWSTVATLTSPKSEACDFASEAPTRLTSDLLAHEQVKYSLKKRS